MNRKHANKYKQMNRDYQKEARQPLPTQLCFVGFRVQLRTSIPERTEIVHHAHDKYQNIQRHVMKEWKFPRQWYNKVVNNVDRENVQSAEGMHHISICSDNNTCWTKRVVCRTKFFGMFILRHVRYEDNACSNAFVTLSCHHVNLNEDALVVV